MAEPAALIGDPREAPAVLLERPRDLGNVGACIRVAAAADAGDAKRRSLKDRAVVGLAPAQRLRGVRTADELAQLDACRGQHRHLVVLQGARPLGDQLHDTDHLAAVHDRECDGRPQAGAARGLHAPEVGRVLEVGVASEHAGLPDAPDQPGPVDNDQTEARVKEPLDRGA